MKQKNNMDDFCNAWNSRVFEFHKRLCVTKKFEGDFIVLSFEHGDEDNPDVIEFKFDIRRKSDEEFNVFYEYPSFNVVKNCNENLNVSSRKIFSSEVDEKCIITFSVTDEEFGNYCMSNREIEINFGYNMVTFSNYTENEDFSDLCDRLGLPDKERFHEFLVCENGEEIFKILL